ncbi:type II-B CRISPR-associated RNA-guided endonuclease Cas9/Csx12 [Endozoicomonas sp. ALB032]|uniref:type II-B CRISPR-associated RNA-guided endonuclease Cas9/Csx12 n=1 Tax=Endozoicomonas sp. ALB032 TaxID=3403082 RepID=UPI003BB74E31
MTTIISPIAIDLGAKYTGVHTMHYHQGEDPRNSPLNSGYVLLLDDDNFQLSQQGRTQVRHQGRNYDRRKLAKRLLLTILKDIYAVNPYTWSEKDREFLFGLLNRRGFNRFDDESLSKPPACSPSAFEHIIPELAGYNDIEEWLQRTAEDSSAIHEAIERLGKTRDFSKGLPAEWRDDKKIIESAHKYMCEFLKTRINAHEEGHLHRRDYLQNIASDICLEKDGKLKEIFSQTPLSVDEFSKLIGHVSNLKLSTLRRYFNDSSFSKSKKGDYWDEERFSKQFWRSIKNWHCDQQTKANWQKLLKLRKTQQSVINLMLTIDPLLTIPPYEDQNNRRPPKDKTLYFSASALDRAYPRWRIIVERILRHQPELDEPHAETVARLDAALDKDGILLMRILDRSRDWDPYQIRALSTGKPEKGNKLKAAMDELLLHLSQHAEPFLSKIARPYYQQIADARKGLWSPEDDNNLLLSLNRTPQRKANQLPKLLGRIIGSDLGDKAEQKIDNLKSAWGIGGGKFNGRSIKGWCKLASELQKDHGNRLKTHLLQFQSLRDRIESGLTETKLPKHGKDLLKLADTAGTVADFITDKLNLSPENARRFSNIFQLAQIYNLLESDPSGFSHSSQPTAEENLWRMKTVNQDGKDCARACLLSSDSIRPFDGMLGRILEKQAYAIANEKNRQIAESSPDNCSLVVPILLEENRFQFAEDLYTIKRNKKKKKDAQKGGESELARFRDKEQRIREASQGICAYTGHSLGRYGEYDHIIPRSYTQKRMGTVFNSEANLLFVSSTGNQKKGDTTYTLSELSSNYLENIFGTSDIKAIEATIRKKAQPFIDRKELISFHTLTAEEQQAIRHGLFIPGFRDELLQLLAGQRKARVNGTQAWLAKRIMHYIRKVQGNRVRFELVKVPVESVQLCRGILASQHPELAKASPQPIASHAIDAALVSGSLLMESSVARALKIAPVSSEKQAEWLNSLLPESIDIRVLRKKPLYRKDDLASSRLFKAGLYAERFIPLLVFSDRLRLGFTPENSVKVLKGAEQLYALLHPCLRSHNTELPLNLDELQAQLSDNDMVTAYIDRPTAFAFLHKNGQQAEFELHCTALEKMMYVTQKKKLEVHLYDSKNKCFRKRDDVLAGKFFQINAELPATIAKVEKHKLTLPCYKEWEKVCNDQDIADNLGKKRELTSNYWRNMGQRLFPETQQETAHQHKKVRKIYSLPIKAAGGSYRVRRTSLDGRTVWQQLAVDSFGAAGFAKNQGKTQWDQVVELPHFSNSQDLTSLDRSLNKRADDITFFDDWRELIVPKDLPLPDGIMSVSCAPGSKDRIRTRVTLTESSLLNWYNKENNADLKYSWELQPSLPHKQLINWDIFKHDLIPLPRKDKGNAQILRLGKTIVFEYIANDNMKPVLQIAYEQGVPECI